MKKRKMTAVEERAAFDERLASACALPREALDGPPLPSSHEDVDSRTNFLIRCGQVRS